MTPTNPIPEGMKAWHGGDSAPEDWDGGPVLCRDGMILQPTEEAWDNTEDPWDYIAYTPKPTPPVGDSAAERARVDVDVLQRAVDHSRACLSTISSDTKHVQIERAALRTLLAFASQEAAQVGSGKTCDVLPPRHTPEALPGAQGCILPHGHIGNHIESIDGSYFFWTDGQECDCCDPADADRCFDFGKVAPAHVGEHLAVAKGGVTYDERVEYEDRILAAEMRVVALTRALKRFAAKADKWEANHAYQGSDSTQVQHRLGDFRAARSTIAEHGISSGDEE